MKEMLMQLHGMINAGAEEEKTTLLKIFARGLGKLAAEGSADAQNTLLEAAHFAAGMISCPKCKGKLMATYKIELWYMDGTLALPAEPFDEDECLYCNMTGYVDKGTLHREVEVIKETKVAKPKPHEHGTCPKCSGTGTTTYIEKLYYLDDTFAEEREREADECLYCNATGRI